MGAGSLRPDGSCKHKPNARGPGPRIPRVYGTGPTEVCGDCGMWRTAWETPGPWRAEAELVEAMKEDENR